MDAAWMIRGFGQRKDVLGLLAERECLYQKLTQTKPENLMKNFAAYTIDPHSRYPNLHFNVSTVCKRVLPNLACNLRGEEPVVMATGHFLHADAKVLLH